MSVKLVQMLSNLDLPNDTRNYVIVQDISGGENNRIYASKIRKDQVAVLYNADLSFPADSRKRPGSVMIGNDIGSASPVVLKNFTVQNGTDQLLMYEDTSLHKWLGSAGDWTEMKSDFTTSLVCGIAQGKASGLSSDDVVLIYNGEDNVFMMDSNGNFYDLEDVNTSPPHTLVLAWHNNRWWGLKNDILYYSDPYPEIVTSDIDEVTDGTATGGSTTTLTDTAATFITDGVVVGDWLFNETTSLSSIITAVNSETQITVEEMASANANTNVYHISHYKYGGWDRTTHWFRLPVGEERFLLSTRELGLIAFGENSIWTVFPSTTPAATDQPEQLLDVGVVSKKAVCTYGDTVYFFSHDGLRSLQRSVNDKLQSQVDLPLSYALKDAFNRINWAYISRLSMKAFDNKIFISVPTGATTNETWVYWPATNGFSIITGWSVNCMETYKTSNQPRLYYGAIGDGVVYRGWHGFTDEGTTTTDGTAINYQEEGRKEDFDQPLVDKVGGTIEVRCSRTGSGSIYIYVSIDDNEYVLLGTIPLETTLITFPVSFPVNFGSIAIVTEKFTLDGFGEWRTCQVKLVHSTTNSDKDVIIYERNMTTYKNEYQDEVNNG